MKEASCNFHGGYQAPEKHSDKVKKKQKEKEPDLHVDEEAVMNDDTPLHSGLTVKQHAELKRQEDYEKLRVIQEKEEKVRKKQREVEAAMRILDSCGSHSLSEDYIDEGQLIAWDRSLPAIELEEQKKEAMEMKAEGKHRGTAARVLGIGLEKIAERLEASSFGPHFTIPHQK